MASAADFAKSVASSLRKKDGALLAQQLSLFGGKLRTRGVSPTLAALGASVSVHAVTAKSVSALAGLSSHEYAV
jgi:hypothetical protein